MTTLTVNGSGAASALMPVTPGRIAVQFRAGTANAGTLTFSQTWREIENDTGIPVRDPTESAYSFDLSTQPNGGFEITVVEAGTIIPTIASGTNGQTLFVSLHHLGK